MGPASVSGRAPSPSRSTASFATQSAATPRSSWRSWPPRTWLYGIALRVARDHSRTLARKGGFHPLPRGLQSAAPMPDEAWQLAEARQLAQRLLSELDDDRREIVALVELEELTVPEAAAILGIKLNTAYSRLRLARHDLERAWARVAAKNPREARHG